MGDVEHAELVTVEGHRLAVALEVAARGVEVVEGRFDGGKAELHEATGRVVDVDQQRAPRPAVLEPGMVRAVELDELPETRTARPRRIAATGPLRARHPDPGADHPAAQRLDAAHNIVLLAQLLVRERGPEVGIVCAHERQRARLRGRAQAPITRATALARRESRRATGGEAPPEPPHLPRAQPELFGGPPLRQPPRRKLRQHL